MNEDKLTSSAKQLATEISPERDLWPEIEAAIVQPATKRPRWTPMLAQAAAVVLLVGASSGLTYLVVKDDRSAVVPQETATDYYVARAAFGSNYTLGSDYEDARAELLENFEQELARLSPEERQDIVTSLGVIRGAIDDINAALADDPDNTLLQDLLIKSYREELNVLSKVGGATQSVMLRRDI